MAPDGDERETLTRDECLALLEGEDFGRLALSVGALPRVVPIRYEVVGGTIVLGVSSDPGVAAATDDAVIAFQVDHNDPEGESWTVLVQGRTAARVPGPAEDLVPEALIPPGGAARPFHRVRLRVDLVEGFRWRSRSAIDVRSEL